MSIETLLTLGLAVVILAVAFVLRLVILTLLGVALRLAGKDASWLKPQRVERARPPLRPRVASTLRRGAAGVAFLAALAAAAGAAAGRGAVRGAAELERWADAANRRLAPHTMQLATAARRRAAAAAARLGSALVTVVATLQHVSAVLGARLRQRLQRPTITAEQPRSPRRVIDLERDDDPLGPAPRRRPSAEVRS